MGDFHNRLVFNLETWILVYIFSILDDLIFNKQGGWVMGKTEIPLQYLVMGSVNKKANMSSGTALGPALPYPMALDSWEGGQWLCETEQTTASIR